MSVRDPTATVAPGRVPQLAGSRARAEAVAGRPLPTPTALHDWQHDW
ncbi:hypothetical protein [Geodermatophilus sp. TF02-6]|nr:hypothetical protein [Geodermatophilus sp. TF02-6]